jgi:hypothetical protein
MNKQQQDKQIIENAPEGAVSVSNWAYRLRSGNLMVLPKGCDCQDNEYYRSLSDIRELVQLRAEVEEKDKRIAEVEIDVIARDLLIQEQDKRIAELEDEIKVIPALRSRIEKQQGIIHALEDTLSKSERVIRVPDNENTAHEYDLKP